MKVLRQSPGFFYCCEIYLSEPLSSQSMKALLYAFAALATAASVILPAFAASARPVEPDYPCYIKTSIGQVIDLTSLCLSPIPSSPQPIAPATPPLIFSNEEPRQESQPGEGENSS